VLYGYHGSAVERCDGILMRPLHSLSRLDREGLTTTLCSIDDYCRIYRTGRGQEAKTNRAAVGSRSALVVDINIGMRRLRG
jgi:hypothetical protein